MIVIIILIDKSYRKSSKRSTSSIYLHVSGRVLLYLERDKWTAPEKGAAAVRVEPHDSGLHQRLGGKAEGSAASLPQSVWSPLNCPVLMGPWYLCSRYFTCCGGYGEGI